MKNLSLFTSITIILIIIGATLIIGGNPIGEYLTIIGAITGLYSCYLMDLKEGAKPENQI